MDERKLYGFAFIREFIFEVIQKKPIFRERSCWRCLSFSSRRIGVDILVEYAEGIGLGPKRQKGVYWLRRTAE